MRRFSPGFDLLHPIAPDVPHGRESFAWAVPVPHEGLLAFLYTARDADTCRYSTTGVIEVGGRTVEFESMGHRDYSWGPRDWRPIHRLSSSGGAPPGAGAE